MLPMRDIAARHRVLRAQATGSNESGLLLPPKHNVLSVSMTIPA
jgi:hypothetical protein